MVTAEEQKLFTEVGPGTPGGELLRRYWFPIAAVGELDENPVKPVKLLGESLVLYRDRSGTLGLIDSKCAHRRANMALGVPEDKGLRCPYHGWRFAESGQKRSHGGKRQRRAGKRPVIEYDLLHAPCAQALCQAVDVPQNLSRAYG